MRVFADDADPRQMCDEHLIAFIEHCGRQMLAANLLFEGTNDQAMRLMRRCWLTRQEAALRERNRRPHLVAAMETARGLQ